MPRRHLQTDRFDGEKCLSQHFALVARESIGTLRETCESWTCGWDPQITTNNRIIYLNPLTKRFRSEFLQLVTSKVVNCTNQITPCAMNKFPVVTAQMSFHLDQFSTTENPSMRTSKAVHLCLYYRCNTSPLLTWYRRRKESSYTNARNPSEL